MIPHHHLEEDRELEVPNFQELGNFRMSHQKGIIIFAIIIILLCCKCSIFFSICRLKELERGFVIDSVALSKHANDETGRTHPSLNLGIPQYNALKDPHCKAYFRMKGLPKYTNQEKLPQGDVDGGSTSSMMGAVFDQFLRNSSAKEYLKERESIGAGIQ